MDNTQDVYLEDLRKEAGLTPSQVLNAVREKAPEVAPSHRSGIVHWENQGILDFRIIDTLAVIYAKPSEVVKAAALASKRRFQQAPRKLLK